MANNHGLEPNIDIKVCATELIYDDSFKGYKKRKRYFKIDRIVPTSKTTVTIHLL